MPTMCHIFFFLSLSPLTTARVFHVGLLGPYQLPYAYGPGALGALYASLKDLQNNPDLEWFWKEGHQIELVWRDSKCDETVALGEILDLWADKQHDKPDIDVFIGPACESVCQTLGRIADVIKIPMISYGCTARVLSDKTIYSTFARTVPTTDTSFILQIFRNFGWSLVCIVTTPEFLSQAETIKADLTRGKIESGIAVFFAQEDTKKDSMDRLLHIASSYRVFLIVTNNADTGTFMELAYVQGLTSGLFAYVTIAAALTAVYENDGWTFASKPSDPRIFEGLLSVSLFNDYGRPEDDLFHVKVIEGSKKLPFENNIVHESQLSEFAHTVYDALLLYALALNATFHAHNGSNFTKMDVMRQIFDRRFESTQGEMYIDMNGDPQPTFTLRNLQNGSWLHTLTYEPWKGTRVVRKRNVTIIWPGGGTAVIPDGPPCNPITGNCTEFNIITTVVVPIVVLLTLIIFIVLGFLRWRSKRKAERESQEWKVASIDVILDQASVSRVSLRQASMTSLGSHISAVLDRANSMDKTALGGFFPGSLSSSFRLGTYYGRMVAVKFIKKSYVALTDDVIMELNQVRNLNDPNVNRFVGACVEPERIMVLSTYCSKGSLHDVLARDSIKLDNLFKLSFATDMAQGMLYIHQSPIRFHGRLKSTNVLIDSRWSAKVADMGLWRFREGEHHPEPKSKAYYQELFWTAPEHLVEDELTRTGSPKGDVYSFAVILHEIMVRQGPFGVVLLGEEPGEIISRVCLKEHPPYRPIVQEYDGEECMLDLMRCCWEDMAFLRPNFTTIRDSLRRMNKGRQMNLVDQMMTMMERYTDDLEDLVVARTRMVHEEKRRAEELLYRMLPKAVAEKLKRGQQVPPESFEHVTVFFSDIVGFTSLAASSTPMQVVDFLNDLYTCFDRIIDNHDVYKVETIGDAYMVVSGLPVRRPKYENAGEICTMALNLLSAIKDFRVRHLPDKKIQLRTGIHSGPVVAGVVGLKMPRYCLFGDTVNFASRMESSGLALRIHVSPDCKALLDVIGVYHLEYRGKVNMKGKGNIDTYFLIGKDGFTKPLPDLNEAATIEEHEFK